MRTTCNTDTAGSDHQELAALKVSSVFRKHRCKVFDFGVQGSAGQAKENDTGMGKLLVENQLTEILVSDHENAVFAPGDGQDILIRKTGRILAGDRNHIMAQGA
jgi:hypothetical protein